jgi:hypothetical protein
MRMNRIINTSISKEYHFIQREILVVNALGLAMCRKTNEECAGSLA